MEEIDQPNNSECNVSTQINPHAYKKRKMGERVIVTMKIDENNKKQKRSEGPPEDCWSWRKYGQKPIKGSPYPRGYYRCSTSKGCLAKKQVEICKTDSTMLIITYTSTHNHPGPNSDSESSPSRPEESVIKPGSVDEKSLGNSVEITDNQPTTSIEEENLEQTQDEIPVNEGTDEELFHYSQSPFNSSQDHIMVNQENSNPFGDQTHGLFYNENIMQQPFCDDSLNLSSIVFKSEENDFYDELEELSSSSFLTSFMRGSLCDDRVLVNP